MPDEIFFVSGFGSLLTDESFPSSLRAGSFTCFGSAFATAARGLMTIGASALAPTDCSAPFVFVPITIGGFSSFAVSFTVS